jgi:hypothetical protein
VYQCRVVRFSDLTAPITPIDCSTAAATGQDGAVRAGVPFPTPRFTDQGDGTIRDHLTGLIWLKNSNCFDFQPWPDAVQLANTLQDTGTPETTDDCGLSDGSVAGDWRLPNVKELQSLIDFSFANPALSNAAGTAKWAEGDAFLNVGEVYWSSTALAGRPVLIWHVDLNEGFTTADTKGSTYFVWPVRGGD